MIEEFLEGTGVYKVSVALLPATTIFMRDPALHENNNLGPLLHICEKDLDPSESNPTWMLMTEHVRWDFYHGHYQCMGCKEIWDRENEGGLKAIWSDGFGTGDEGHA